MLITKSLVTTNVHHYTLGSTQGKIEYQCRNDGIGSWEGKQAQYLNFVITIPEEHLDQDFIFQFVPKSEDFVSPNWQVECDIVYYHNNSSLIISINYRNYSAKLFTTTELLSEVKKFLTDLLQKYVALLNQQEWELFKSSDTLIEQQIVKLHEDGDTEIFDLVRDISKLNAESERLTQLMETKLKEKIFS
jgi:hypothetical protein